MDLSQLSDEDLKALYANDYKKLSDEGLKHIHSQVSQEKADEQQMAASQPQPAASEETTFQKVTNAVAPYAGAAEVAMEHPVLTGLAATGLANAATKIPVVGPALSNLAGKVAGAVVPQPIKNMASGIGTAASAAKDFMAGYGERTAAQMQSNAVQEFSTLSDQYNKQTHNIRQYEKMLSDPKITPDRAAAIQQQKAALEASNAKLGPQIEAAQSRISAAPKGGAVPPTGTAPTAGAAAAEGEGLLSRAGKFAEQALGKVAPIVRFAASAPVQTALIGMTPGTLNTGETQQMAQIHQFQNNFAKLPPAQQSAYFNLPRDKQVQVHAMLMAGQNPSSILGQTNAMTSGYSQELQRLAR
jgi:hypothetical protein